MKIEEGFRPIAQKTRALDQATDEEVSGSPHPQVQKFTSAQLVGLRRVAAELEIVIADLETDRSKLRAYTPELKQILTDFQDLPHVDVHIDKSKAIESHLTAVITAVRTGQESQALSELRETRQCAQQLLDAVGTMVEQE